MEDKLTKIITEKLKRGEKIEVAGVKLIDRKDKYSLEATISFPDVVTPPITVPIEIDEVEASRPTIVEVYPSTQESPGLTWIGYSEPAVCWIEEIPSGISFPPYWKIRTLLKLKKAISD